MSVTGLWAALRDAGRPLSRAGFPRGLAVGLALAILAAVASAALMGLAGWLIVRSAQTGLSVTSTFSWIYPAAGVEALAVVRTAARYGERLTTHEATLQLLARLRARVFASVTQMAPRQLRRFHSGDLLDRVQADIDSLDRVVLAVAMPTVVAAIVGSSGLAVLALIRPTFAVATAVALAVALGGDLVAGRRGRRAGGNPARARAAARSRLVEVLDGQPHQSCPLTGIGTPDSVVADRQLQDRVLLDYVDLHHRRMRVLGRVGERLRNHVVRRDLDVLGQPALVTQFEFDRKRGTTHQRLERRS